MAKKTKKFFGGGTAVQTMGRPQAQPMGRFQPKPMGRPQVQPISTPASVGNALPQKSLQGAPTATPIKLPGVQAALANPSGGMLRGTPTGMKKGGSVKSSASKRADGCCVRGKTRA